MIQRLLALWQQAARSRPSEPFAEHVFGIRHLGEASLVDLYGRDDRGRPRPGLAIAQAVVGILERQADELFEAGRYQIIITPECVPWSGPLWIRLRQRQRHGAARFHVQRFGDRRPALTFATAF